MGSTEEIYFEARTPLQEVADKAELAYGVGAVGAAGYLFLVERPNDRERASDMSESFRKQECAPAQCGTEVTDNIIRHEYFGVDSLGSIVLVGTALLALLHRGRRQTKWIDAPEGREKTSERYMQKQLVRMHEQEQA